MGSSIWRNRTRIPTAGHSGRVWDAGRDPAVANSWHPVSGQRPPASATGTRCVGPLMVLPARKLLFVSAVDGLSARVPVAIMATRLGGYLLDAAMDGTGESLYGRVTGYRTDGESALPGLQLGWKRSGHEVSLESGGTSCACWRVWNTRRYRRWRCPAWHAGLPAWQ